MEHLKMQTANLSDAKYNKLVELFPNAVTESLDTNGHIVRAIDADVLEQEINTRVIKGREERYQFTWPGKSQAVLAGNMATSSTLRPCVGESIGRDGIQGRFDSENLYIEGDNLEVLKLLQETYLGKVRMIYIDQPYNTGSDFVYKDNFTQEARQYLSESGQYDENGGLLVQNLESNGRFHTDWLNMLFPRLRIAKNLLSDNGVIFISIDDKEQENLKKICGEIFGAQNFLFQIAWRRTDNQPNIGKIARVKEYILCFAKNIDMVQLGKLPLTEKAKAEYRYHDDKGLFRRAILLDKTRGRYTYPVITKSGKTLNGPWMKSQDEFNKMDADGAIYWTSGGEEQPYGKIYLSESKGAIPNDFWGIEFGTNQRASIEVEKIFQKRYFDFPKPVSLISTLVTLGMSLDDIVLDFFSGSATTAHAVMQLNAEDGGNRKFIMVQLDEETPEKSEARKAGYPNICEIGKERIRRAGAKIKEETGADIDYGFRVLKCSSSNMKPVYYAPSNTKQEQLDVLADNIKEDRTGEDLLFQVMLELGVPLSSSIEYAEIAGQKVFDVGQNYLLACFDLNVTEASIIEIAKREPTYFVMRDRSMANDTVAANFEQIFRTYSPDTVRRVL